MPAHCACCASCAPSPLTRAETHAAIHRTLAVRRRARVHPRRECGADGGGTGPPSIVGSYLLASVDGAPVPVTLAPGIQPDADRSDMYFGALVLGADGTARMSVCARNTKGSTVWVTYSDQRATYTRGVDALTLAWDAGGTTQARTESDAITLAVGWNTVTLQLRFERRRAARPDADPCL